MYFAGVDVGSVAAKCVILGDDDLVSTAVVPTGWSPKDAGRRVFAAALQTAGLEASDVARVVGTGYGRVALDFLDQAVTEITCHAVGAYRVFPANDAVVDIGGQDSKAIRVGPGGKVLSFVMNDKCAAGTGRFLQVMATTLGMEFDDLESITTAEPASINSMCTVFAESEVVSLLAAGTPKERIIAGLFQSIARRVATMTSSLGALRGVTFTGGVARSSGVRLALARALGCPVASPPEPEFVGALGAAVIAARSGW